MRLLTGRRVVAVVAVMAAVPLAGVAWAYFTATGTGTATGKVVSSANWGVTVSAPQGGPLYPGGPPQKFDYTVTNTGPGNQRLLGHTTQSVVSAVSGGNTVVVQNGTPVAGCLASWFGIQTAHNVRDETLGPGQSVLLGDLSVWMEESDSDQNACRGVSPDITINVT